MPTEWPYMVILTGATRDHKIINWSVHCYNLIPEYSASTDVFPVVASRVERSDNRKYVCAGRLIAEVWHNYYGEQMMGVFVRR